MKAILTNFGTTGDIQPFLALALEMKRHGHNPLLAFASHFRDQVGVLGLDFISIGPDLLEAQNEINSAIMNLPKSSEEMRALFSPLVAALPQMYNELSSACATADVIISGPAQPAGRMVHEVMGIPFVSVQLSHFGGIGSPSLREASAGLINPFREKLGLRALANPLTIDANSPQLALYAVSRHVFPAPVDWPSHH
ncbi:MAG: glycosyltransferase, partial [Blastocatellia bacterium]|nr:glycosyltransferase [Blastocatellia bacterium]